MKPVDISIVVPAWNAADIIAEALESIVRTAGDLSVEVLVIDDASSDGGFDQVREIYRDDPRFHFVRLEKNIGYSASANMLLEQARGTYLMTFDTDARLHPSTLRTLYSFMETHPGAGAATGRLVNPDGTNQGYYRRILTPAYYFFTTPLGRMIDKYFLRLTYYKRYHYDDLDLSKTSEMEQPPVACLIIRREALGTDAYIFDPRFRLYMLDVDFAKRVYDRGYKIYVVHDAPVTHLKTASASKRGSTWLLAELDKSFMGYFKKHHPVLAPLMYIVQVLDRLSRYVLIRLIGREPMR